MARCSGLGWSGRCRPRSSNTIGGIRLNSTAFRGRKRRSPRCRTTSPTITTTSMTGCGPGCLPGEWRTLAGGDVAERARLVADYLAGMTDRFALDEHRRLFDTYASV